MCGIAGIVNTYQNPDYLKMVSSMVGYLNHRGPDFQKIKNYSNAILGHARLSIIDLDTRSTQPFENNNNRYSIVFNGEIYNYNELKQELKKQYNFTTLSDTEVLLASYIIWGKKCLTKLNGMFAFCIYDNYKQKAFLARDRFGQKPLFYFIKKILYTLQAN